MARKAVLIAGPTASGKSGLALALAGKLGGVIVNADSMQVYRELRVLTARPSPEQEAAAPHRLYGHVGAAETYSVGRWLEDAKAAIGQAWSEGRVPVVVGGTGLYFRALERGLAAVPPILAEVREKWRSALAERGAASLHDELARRSSSEASRLRPNDGQRIVRALEVLDATGEPLSAHQARGGVERLLDGAEVERHLLLPDRAQLYRRIDARLERMLAEGALVEVRGLLALGLEPWLPAMKAIGVRPFARHLAGATSLDEALAQAQAETRQYAKRQTTFFRHQLPDWRPSSG